MHSRHPVETHRLFFSAKVYDYQGRSPGGSYQPPPPSTGEGGKIRNMARLSLYIYCCGHCIHFISVNDMPPSNLNIKRIARIKCWERRKRTPTHRHLCHKSDVLTITLLRTLQGRTRKIVGMSRIHRSGMWNGGQVACQVSLQRTKFKHNNDIMKKYVVKNVVGTSYT